MVVVLYWLWFLYSGDEHPESAGTIGQTSRLVSQLPEPQQRAVGATWVHLAPHLFTPFALSPRLPQSHLLLCHVHSETMTCAWPCAFIYRQRPPNPDPLSFTFLLAKIVWIQSVQYVTVPKESWWPYIGRLHPAPYGRVLQSDVLLEYAGSGASGHSQQEAAPG